MIEWLKEWPTRYAYVVLTLAWYVVLYNLIPWSWLSFDIPWQWLEDHEKLSGWAQFAGATFALAVAILVPAWQRYWQSLDKKRDTAELNAANALASFYLLGEVRNHLAGYVANRRMARGILRDDEVRVDLLRRIHALELRDNDATRLTSLFLARGAIHQTHVALGAPAIQHLPMGRGEVALLRKRLEAAQKWVDQAEKIRDQATSHFFRMRLFWMARRIYPLMERIIGKWLRKHVKACAQKTAKPSYKDGHSEDVKMTFKI